MFYFFFQDKYPHLGYSDPEDQIFNCVILDVSTILGETTLTISDSIKTGSPVESDIVRRVSLSTTEINQDKMI